MQNIRSRGRGNVQTGASSALKAALPTNLLFQRAGLFLKNEELILPKFTKPELVILNSNKDQSLLASLQQGSFLEIHELAGCQAKQSWVPLRVSGIPSWTPSSMFQGWGLEERRSDEPGRVSQAEKSPGQFWSPAKAPSQTLASALSI